MVHKRTAYSLTLSVNNKPVFVMNLTDNSNTNQLQVLIPDELNEETNSDFFSDAELHLLANMHLVAALEDNEDYSKC